MSRKAGQEKLKRHDNISKARVILNPKKNNNKSQKLPTLLIKNDWKNDKLQISFRSEQCKSTKCLLFRLNDLLTFRDFCVSFTARRKRLVTNFCFKSYVITVWLTCFACAITVLNISFCSFFKNTAHSYV